MNKYLFYSILTFFLTSSSFQSLAQTEESDIDLIGGIVHQFKEILGPDRSSKLFLSDEILKRDGLNQNLHSWYQVPREEYIIAAIDNSSSSLLGSLFRDPFKDGGILITNKKIYSRRGGTIYFGAFDFLNQKGIKKFHTDNAAAFKMEAKKQAAYYWVDNTQITSFEIFNFIDDLAYAMTTGKKIKAETKAKEEKRLQQIRKENDRKRALEKANKIADQKAEQKRVVLERERKISALKKNQDLFDKESASIGQSSKAQLEFANILYARSDFENAGRIYLRFESELDSDMAVNLGNIYKSGTSSIQQDFVRAMSLFREAKKNGNPRGDASIGIVYYFGQGVPIDYNLAYSYLIKAANYKIPIVHRLLGQIYYFGEGNLNKDLDEAIKWFSFAAFKNDASSCYYLCYIYANQRINKTKAVEWCEKATMLGNTKAAKELAKVRK